jgi:hypothetical protein
MALAQITIGMADAPANIPLLAGSMFLQGVGLGLFQVACFDISTATIPREDRGVARAECIASRRSPAESIPRHPIPHHARLAANFRVLLGLRVRYDDSQMKY